MGVTIKDVAREAGVSTATVSRVLNDSARVRAVTRQRVEEVARRLRYVPSGTARSLILSRTGLIGLVLPGPVERPYGGLVEAVERAGEQAAYHMLLATLDATHARAEAVLREIAGRVDGLVVVSPSLDAGALRAVLPESVPVVLLNVHLPGSPFNTISVDDFGGAYEMVRHLLSHGHRRVAMLRGPDVYYAAPKRLQGYRAAMVEAGARTLELEGDLTEGGGHRAVASLLGAVERPTALFAANDAMAIGALGALQAAGVRVPEEMALAGFGDTDAAPYVHPALSTVQAPWRTLGTRAVQHLLHVITAPVASRRQDVLRARLVLRRSCGCG